MDFVYGEEFSHFLLHFQSFKKKVSQIVEFNIYRAFCEIKLGDHAGAVEDCNEVQLICTSNYQLESVKHLSYGRGSVPWKVCKDKLTVATTN